MGRGAGNGLLAEEDEPTVAVDFERGRLVVQRECEALRDGDFHLADGAVRDRVQVHERAVLAVHDEVACGAAFFGHLDEVVDGEAAAPCW